MSLTEIEGIFHWSSSWYLSLLPKFKDVLSKIHCESNLTDEAWEILIGWWLAASLDLILVRLVEAKLALSKWPDMTFHAVDWNGCLEHVADVSGLYNDEACNAWLHSYFLNKNFLFEVPSVVNAIDSNVSGSGEIFKYRKFISKSQKLIFSKAISKFDQLRLALSIYKVPTTWKSFTLPPLMLNQEIRESLKSQLHSENSLENGILDLLIRLCPKSYLEAFAAYRDRALSQLPEGDLAFIGQVETMFDDSYKFAVAFAKSTSSSISVAQQHGGTYGMAKFHRPQYIEPRCCDHWLSFGWKGELVNYASKSRLLRRFSKNISSNKGDDILFVLSNFPRYTFYLAAVPQGPLFAKWLGHVLDLVLKVVAIDGAPARVRAFKDIYNWDLEEFLLSNRNLISLEDALEVPITESVGRASVVITCTNGTNLLELMFANVPTIIYLDSEYWPLNPDYSAVFNGLSELGILHFSKETAVLKILEIRNNPTRWWNSAKIQQARLNFCSFFAR
jgi:putative transferase (TIGR04331 family)